MAIVRVDGRSTAYILIDGNNMVPGLRDRVIDRLPDLEVAEVKTTDTHVTNRTTATNRVGDAIDEEVVLSLVERLVNAARRDLVPVTAGLETEYAEVCVFGTGRETRLASIGTVMTSVGRILVVVLLVAAVAMTAIWFTALGLA